MNNNVPDSYKQTEVGVIPVDWSAVDFISFGQVIDGDRGVHYPGAGDFRDAGYCLFLNAGNVTKSGFRFSDCQFISLEIDKKLNKGKLERGDVVLTTRGTLGNFAYFDEEIPFAQIRINSGMVILRNISKTVDGAYQYFVLRSQIVASQIERLSFGSAQPQLTVKGISTLKIPFPPTLAEQKAIAEALSDTDALIESLEQLITKKCLIKQGAMQELLTGKKRLPGFSGEWEERSVAMLGNIVTGGTPPTANRIFWDGDFPWITPTDISTHRDICTSERCISASGLKVLRPLPANTVLVTCIASIGKNAVLKVAGGCNQQINAVIPNDEHDATFLYYIFEISKGYLLGNAGTTATSIISKTIFQELVFSVPPTKAEQTAIAAILSDMDAEITALETKLTKARQLKQGMMQELLTGRIRLI